MMEIYKTFNFDAAHQLTNLPPGHRCGNLHGHTFLVEIHVSGSINTDQGWVMDFAHIKRCFQPIFEQLDHSYLNDIKGLENPTSENIAFWIWEKLKPELPELIRVVVKESPESAAVYSGE